MSFLEGTGLLLGIGIAIGMLAGTTGTRGSARGRMTLLAAVIGFATGLLLAGVADLSLLAAGLFGALGAAVACIVISDVISGASRREGGRSAALGFLSSAAAAQQGVRPHGVAASSGDARQVRRSRVVARGVVLVPALTRAPAPAAADSLFHRCGACGSGGGG